MALQMNRTVKGFALPNCYARVIHVRASRSVENVIVSIGIFCSPTEADEIDTISVVLPYSPDASVAWAYTQLKTLPEFVGATDV